MAQTSPDLPAQHWRKHAAPLAFAIVGAVSAACVVFLDGSQWYGSAAAAVVACSISAFYFGRLVASASRQRRPWVVAALTSAFPAVLFAAGYTTYVVIYAAVEEYPYSLSLSEALGGVAFLFPPYVRFVYPWVLAAAAIVSGYLYRRYGGEAT